MARLILMMVTALVLTACDYTEVEREIGYKGRARINPWLAAERFTSRMGWETRSVLTWSAPDDRDAVWVLPAVALGNESYIRQTESWVRGGGHLILLVDNADAETNDWSGHSIHPELEPPFDAMLQRAGITLTNRAPATSGEINFEGQVFKVDAKSDCSVKAGDDQPGVFESVRHGKGRLSILTDARLFRNRWIAEHDHAAFLDALIADAEYDGCVVFMRGTGFSLWGLLVRHLWPVLIGSGIWLALWLMKNLTRFGPLESATTTAELRGYEYHLEALGDFQWRLDRASSLLAPLRAQIVELGQRAVVIAGRHDEDFFQFLADRAGITRERAFRALAETAPADAAILTRTTADLQQLLKVLNHSAQS